MPGNHENEGDVFAAFRAGDPETIAAVRGWVTQVVAHAAWRFGDAESVVQDVLLKLLAIARLDRFRRMSSFRTFVISVARNTCIDVYRRQRWRERVEGRQDAGGGIVVAADDPEALHRAQERRELLRYVIQRLPDECRRLWTWIYGEGLAARNVAERLGISETNVRVRAHRCLRKARSIAASFLTQGA